ncbi:hypothetical protein PFISCL1PPCAC_14284, partial [Pristionchus fissidentatus]
LLSIVIYQAASQCMATENARCKTWVSNGFCGSSFYTTSQKQSYCGFSCGLCGNGGSSCSDQNANCAKWAGAGKCSVASISATICCSSCKTATTGAAGTITTTAAVTTTTAP